MGTTMREAERHESLEQPRIALLNAISIDLAQLRVRVQHEKITIEEGYRQFTSLTRPLTSLKPMSVVHILDWAKEHQDAATFRTAHEADSLAQSWLHILPAVARQQEQYAEKSREHIIDAIQYFIENLPALIRAEQVLEQCDERILNEPQSQPSAVPVSPRRKDLRAA